MHISSQISGEKLLVVDLVSNENMLILFFT